MPNSEIILVTGATGSLGQELVRQLSSNDNRVIALSRDERKQAKMQQRFPEIDYVIADVRDSRALSRIFKYADYVIHAAAMKRIDSCGDNPFEAVMTNILGAQNIIDAASENGVKKVIAISSDKAVHPSNLYGGTKLVADHLFMRANGNTRFSTVRMGNFWHSRGSVQEYWSELWEHGEKYLPLTDERVTRFFITLSDAANFVLFCLDNMIGGEIFVPKMQSHKITSFAPEGTEFLITGMRPGEKIHEKAICQEDARNTVEFDNYYITYPSGIPDDIAVSNVPEGFEYSSG